MEGATVDHGRKTWQQAEKASALRKLDVNKKWVTVERLEDYPVTHLLPNGVVGTILERSVHTHEPVRHFTSTTLTH